MAFGGKCLKTWGLLHNNCSRTVCLYLFMDLFIKSFKESKTHVLYFCYMFFFFYVSTIKLQIKKIAQIKVFFFKTKEKDRKKHKVYFYKKEKVKNCAASVFPVPCSYNKEP